MPIGPPPATGLDASPPSRPPQTFASEADRVRLTPAALEALRGLARAWHLSVQEAAELVGVPASAWERIRAGTWKHALTQDQFMRVSALVGVFKGLHLLFADDMADRWV